jgi:acetyl-CoA carboxylase beta subunit
MILTKSRNKSKVAVVLVQCPSCHTAVAVNHMEWCSLMCMECKADMENPFHAGFHVGDQCLKD